MSAAAPVSVLRGRDARAPVRGDEPADLRRWLHGWNALARWTRYEVHGIEHIPIDRASLVTGYHGRPIAHDLCMLQNAFYGRTGVMPHPIFHAAFAENPRGRQFMETLGFVWANDERLADFVARGEPIFVTPGGTREGCRSARHRYQVHWGGRTGYIKLALAHGMPVVPVASAGADDLYLGLNDGYAWGKKLGVPHDMPAWLGFGLLGVWPVAVPFPVRVRTYVGAPIDLQADGPVDPRDRDHLLALHERVTGAVQDLLARARGRGGSER